MYKIGQTIANLRKQRKMTQEELAGIIGVSTQSVSKWENSTNMPDILLLPVIADVFGVTIDDLYGRGKEHRSCNPDEVFNTGCEKLKQTLFSVMYRADLDDTYEIAYERYSQSLEKDTRHRSGVLRKHGIVYYRQPIGGLLMKRPEKGWHDLLTREDTADILNLLSDRDFRNALASIIKTKMTTFTLPSLCSICKIGDAGKLEQKIKQSTLFTSKTLPIDGKDITIYELMWGQKLFLVFAVLTYAAEFSEYEDIYTGYHGDGSYYMD